MTAQFIPLLAILPLLGFYLWMFWHMTVNTGLGPDEKTNWAWAFLLLNLGAACVYYVNVYRSGRRR